MAALAGPNGLHPRGCACAVCEVGCGPTDAARAVADRAAAQATFARERAAKRLQRERDREQLHRHLVAVTNEQVAKWHTVKLPTEAERVELAQLRRMLCPRGKVGR